jgi:hypothetical protein
MTTKNKETNQADRDSDLSAASGSKWKINVTDSEWELLTCACANMRPCENALLSVRAAYAETRGHSI